MYICFFLIFRLINFFVSVTFVENKDGKQLAVFEGYTYYSCDRYRVLPCSMWRCTKGYPCKARFKATHNGEVVRITSLEHNHDPPRIEIHNGILKKVSKKEMLRKNCYYYQ